MFAYLIPLLVIGAVVPLVEAGIGTSVHENALSTTLEGASEANSSPLALLVIYGMIGAVLPYSFGILPWWVDLILGIYKLAIIYIVLKHIRG